MEEGKGRRGQRILRVHACPGFLQEVLLGPYERKFSVLSLRGPLSNSASQELILQDHHQQL